MWFKNATVFHVENMPSFKLLETALKENLLKPCPPHARYVYGWLPSFNDLPVYSCNGAMIFSMGKEERLLPTMVIKQALDEKIAEIEAKEARNVKRSERNQLKEDLEFNLLPKSFTVVKSTWAYLDTINNRLIVNTPNANVASDLAALLMKTVKDNFALTAIKIDTKVNTLLTESVKSPAFLPSQLSLRDCCQLIDPNNESKRLNCKGYELPCEEVEHLLAKGLSVSELALNFDERIDFTFHERFIFKGLKFIGVLEEEFNDAKKSETELQAIDASLFLMSTEINRLITAMLTFLSSERKKNNMEFKKSCSESEKESAA